MKKTYFVFGAAGHIGREVVSRLNEDGHTVVASVRNEHSKLCEQFIKNGVYIQKVQDVADKEELKPTSFFQHLFPEINGVIYTVGHCPPDGFPEAIKYPLSQLPLDGYVKEIGMHQLGVLNVFQSFVHRIRVGGCFIFISSAITRLRGKFPPFLQAYHHASVIDAEDWLVEGMRHDPLVVERKIKIHRLAPSAIDTPFHRVGPKPPKLLPTSAVIEEVALALASDTEIDKQIL